MFFAESDLNTLKLCLKGSCRRLCYFSVQCALGGFEGEHVLSFLVKKMCRSKNGHCYQIFFLCFRRLQEALDVGNQAKTPYKCTKTTVALVHKHKVFGDECIKHVSPGDTKNRIKNKKWWVILFFSCDKGTIKSVFLHSWMHVGVMFKSFVLGVGVQFWNAL